MQCPRTAARELGPVTAPPGAATTLTVTIPQPNCGRLRADVRVRPLRLLVLHANQTSCCVCADTKVDRELPRAHEELHSQRTRSPTSTSATSTL